jgi:hypothetical protein
LKCAAAPFTVFRFSFIRKNRIPRRAPENVLIFIGSVVPDLFRHLFTGGIGIQKRACRLKE